MDIQHEDNGKQGRFFVQKAGHDVAEIAYHWGSDGKIVIDHTEVDESLKGQGAGKTLVNKVVELAREKGVKILPLCPYAKAVMEKGAEYQDILWKKEA